MTTALRQLLRSKASRRIASACTTWAAMFRNGVGKKLMTVKSDDEAHPGRIQQRMLFLLLIKSSSLHRSNVRYSSDFAACSKGQLRRRTNDCLTLTPKFESSSSSSSSISRRFLQRREPDCPAIILSS